MMSFSVSDCIGRNYCEDRLRSGISIFWAEAESAETHKNEMKCQWFLC